jgi:hypothetical protein
VGGLHTTDSDGEDVGLPGKSASDFLDAYPNLNLDVAEISDRGWWHKVRWRGWVRPPCRHFKTQSCLRLGSAFEVAAFPNPNSGVGLLCGADQRR